MKTINVYEKHLISTCMVLFTMLLTIQNNNANPCFDKLDASENSTLQTRIYVSEQGNDNNSGNDPSSPFLTIKKALQTAQPNSIIHIMPGIYYVFLPLEFANSGTSTGGIVLTNYNGGNAVIDGSNSERILSLVDREYITISNLKFQGGKNGIYVGGSSSNIEILNCDIKDVQWTNNKEAVPNAWNNASPLQVVGTTNTAITNIKISGNHIHDCITGFSEALTITGNVNGFVVSNNVIEDITNIGIDIAGRYDWVEENGTVSEANNKARNGQVIDNIVSECKSPYGKRNSAGIYIDGAESVTVERNISHNNGAGFSIGCENDGHEVTGIIFRNNVAYNNEKEGLRFGSNQPNSKIKDSYVVNNTFYNNFQNQGIVPVTNQEFIDAHKAGGPIPEDGAEIILQNCKNSVIEHNIIAPKSHATKKNYGVAVWGFTVEEEKVQFNLFSDPMVDFLVNVNRGSGNRVDNDPKFINGQANPPNLSIQSTSPAVNAGNPSSTSSLGNTDAAGNNRRNGRVDIGAYEYQ